MKKEKRLSVELKSDIKPQELDEWFLKLLACPGCVEKRPVRLSEDRQTLLCECGKYSFPIRDGLPILLVGEATQLIPDEGNELISDKNENGTEVIG